MSDQLKRFDARFDSQCNSCGADIYEGDPMARTPDGDYICDDCIQGWED